MKLSHYIADCPACGKCRMRLRDLPGKGREDRWTYEWLDHCLSCGLQGELAQLPPGARDFEYAEAGKHLATQLARFRLGGGANRAVEPHWREALAKEHMKVDNTGAAFAELRLALELVTQPENREMWWRLVTSLVACARTDEDRLRVLDRIEKAITVTTVQVPDLAALLMQLVTLHAGLRDFKAAWGAGEQAFAMYRDSTDPTHRGAGMCSAGWELIAIGAQLGRDTSIYEAAVRAEWTVSFGDMLDGMITERKSRYGGHTVQ